MSTQYDRIKDLCWKRKHCTISAFAKELGIHRTKLAELKKARDEDRISLPIEQLYLIADKLECSISYLLCLEERLYVDGLEFGIDNACCFGRDENNMSIIKPDLKSRRFAEYVKFYLFRNTRDVTDEMLDQVKVYAKELLQKQNQDGDLK